MFPRIEPTGLTQPRPRVDEPSTDRAAPIDPVRPASAAAPATDAAAPAAPAAPAGSTSRASAGPILSGTHTIRTGRRVEITKEVREVRRLRVATVVIVVLAVIGAPLAVYAIKEAVKDPVFAEIDALDVPRWAARAPRDEASGSRWCLERCRFRQRTAQSDREAEETSAIYAKALRDAGWRPWRVAGCSQEGLPGFETCWQRDEYVLDLWVYQPECEVELRKPDPNQAATPSAPAAVAVCPLTSVTLRVINRVAFRTGSGAPA
jgi:hypothetical protein